MKSAPDTGYQESVLRLHEMAYSLGLSAALLAATRLNVAETLKDEPMRIGELAAATGTDPTALRRLMRTLACHGVFNELDEDTFEHNELSRPLRADAPGSRRDWVLLAGAPFAWRVWSRLEDSVRTGKSVFADLYGKSMFEHITEDEPEVGGVFDRAAAKSTESAAASLAATLDIGTATTVADIGGGRGKLLRALLEKHPDLHGVLFDLPRALAGADPELREGGSLAPRCRLMPGDCQQDMPVKADIYLFKGVVHMWDDDVVVSVLRILARSAPPGARVVFMEQLVNSTTAPRITSVIDLLMLVTQGGTERTEKEFRDVFERAGLRFRGVTPAGPLTHLIEAVTPD